MAPRRLHETLTELTVYQERSPSTIAPLTFPYSNTADSVGTIDGLRSLVVKHVCCYIRTLHTEANFTDNTKVADPFFVYVLPALLHSEH